MKGSFGPSSYAMVSQHLCCFSHQVFRNFHVLGTGYMFSRAQSALTICLMRSVHLAFVCAWHLFPVFPRLALTMCVFLFGGNDILCRTWYRFHVFPRLTLFACLELISCFALVACFRPFSPVCTSR